MAKWKHTRPLSDRLRERIEEDGRSVSALARAAGVGRVTLWRFVRERRNITLKTADQLAVVLGVHLADAEGMPRSA
jgi:plasmid maintenance system antidote protein VapI